MDEAEYKPFDQTYKIITFSLCSMFIYPNPKEKNFRKNLLVVVLISPLLLFILFDMLICWQENDMINVFRHSTVVGPLIGGFFKAVLMYTKEVQASQIIEEMSRDLLLYNHFDQKYKNIANAGIRNSQKYTEKYWSITVIICVMTFPIIAISYNTYSYLFEAEPKSYMIHDIRLHGVDPDLRFQSPYFEIIFVYMFCASLMYITNFVGYDGFFGLAINHACLKMDLFCAALEDAMLAERKEIYGRVVGVIKEQCRMFDFVELIQDTFNTWLGIIFVATMIQICTCVYQITEGYSFDIRYMIFTAGAVAHIYVPCRYSAKLKAMSLETATKIYSCSWEQMYEEPVRKLIMLMIARAQVPNEITAFKFLTFDMELFSSIMQTSYSMYMLLKS